MPRPLALPVGVGLAGGRFVLFGLRCFYLPLRKAPGDSSFVYLGAGAESTLALRNQPLMAVGFGRALIGRPVACRGASNRNFAARALTRRYRACMSVRRLSLFLVAPALIAGQPRSRFRRVRVRPEFNARFW